MSICFADNRMEFASEVVIPLTIHQEMLFIFYLTFLTNWTCSWLAEWVSDVRLNNWLMFDLPTDWLAHWLTDVWLTYWLTDGCLTDCCLTESLIDWCLTDTEWLTCWLTDVWLNNWLTDWLKSGWLKWRAAILTLRCVFTRQTKACKVVFTNTGWLVWTPKKQFANMLAPFLLTRVCKALKTP